MTSFVSPHAVVEDGAELGSNCSIWDLVRIRAGAVVGDECVIGRGAFIDADVIIGSRCKVQNEALIYSPARIGDGVFIGPAVVLTNDRYPRAIGPDGLPSVRGQWTPEGVTVEYGASLGARAVVVAGVTIGAWAMVAAGSVVASSVLAYTLVAGTPARQIGWVGRAGRRLVEQGVDEWTCPTTSERYRLTDGRMELLDA